LFREFRFDDRLDDGHAIGIDVVEERFAFGCIFRGFVSKESVVETDFDAVSGGCADPVDRSFDFAFGGGAAAAARVGVVATFQFDDIAGGVLDHFIAADDVGVSQSDFPPWLQSEEFRRSVLHEVFALDEQRSGERQWSRTGVGIFGVVDGFEMFDLIDRIVSQGDFDGCEDRHVAIGDFVQVFSNGVFEDEYIDGSIEASDPDGFAETADAFGRIATAAKSTESRHARIIPAGDMPFGHELEEFPFAHDGVGQIQPGELELTRMEDTEGFAEPIVERAMVFKFEGADRVRDAFDRVRLSVCPIVHRVDAPIVTCAVMMGFHDPVKHRVAEVQVRSGHVDFGAERSDTFGELPLFHPFKEIEVFFDAAVAVGAVLTGLGQCTSVLAHLLRIEIAYKSVALANELDRPVVQLLEVIRSVEQAVPFEAEPSDIGHDGVDVFLALFAGVRVVESQVAFPAIALGETKVEADALGVSDMQVAVGFGGKTRLESASAQRFLEGKILFDFDLDEVFVRAVVRRIRWMVHCGCRSGLVGRASHRGGDRHVGFWQRKRGTEVHRGPTVSGKASMQLPGLQVRRVVPVRRVGWQNESDGLAWRRGSP
jgi:hypothetical protein